MALLRTRIGNWRIGLRVERLPHTFVTRFVFSHIADTIGILNRFSDTKLMCLFLDLDDHNQDSDIYELLALLTKDKLSYYVFETSKKHINIISPTLLSKDGLDILMKKYMRFIDYRFAYVYYRDGYNAIRLTPKLIDGRLNKEMKLIATSSNYYSVAHKGLTDLIYDIYGQEYLGIVNDSTTNDLIKREYETINWSME